MYDGYDFDVNHSWWVPDLGGKYDAIPGTTNHTWFEAPQGTYIARCAELCGIQHALMDGKVKVDELVTQEIPLEKINWAFEQMAQDAAYRFIIKY